MRFGPFVLQANDDPALDSQIIDRTLREAKLAEDLGYDAVWLGEHHFAGTEVYADPVVFGAAVAAATKRIKIGFAVAQITLHHPVRLAVQTALLDNLSHGRLIVGTARGTGIRLWEYTGFGITIDEGFDRLAEAEELVLKAWTEESVDFQGKYWTVAFPQLRPKPYQKPHPPMPRGCTTEGSVRAMAKVCRPIMLWSQYGADSEDNFAKRQIQIYRETALESGFTENEVEGAVDQSWLMPFLALYVADSDQQAEEEAAPTALRQWTDSNIVRAKLNAADRQTRNPTELVKSIMKGSGVVLDSDQRTRDARQGAELLVKNSLLAGSPKLVAEKIAEQRDTGFRNILFPMSLTNIPEEKVAYSMRLFAEKVAPLFRKD